MLCVFNAKNTKMETDKGIEEGDIVIRNSFFSEISEVRT